MGTGVQIYDLKSMQSSTSSKSLCKNESDRKATGKKVKYRPVSSFVRCSKKNNPDEIIEGMREKLHSFIELRTLSNKSKTKRISRGEILVSHSSGNNSGRYSGHRSL